jgi:hypothetical protein
MSAITLFDAMPSGANTAYLSLLAALLLPSANQKNSAFSASGFFVPMIWPPKPTAMYRPVLDFCVPH